MQLGLWKRRSNPKQSHPPMLVPSDGNKYRGRFQHRIFKHCTRTTSEWEVEPPPSGIVRLDVVASVQQNNQAAYNGVLRDTQGRWIMGFKRNLGIYPVAVAEILVIKVGIEVSKQLNIQNVQIHSNSLEAINILMRDSGVNHPYRAEIEATCQLIYGADNVGIFQTNREVIESADILAREAHWIGDQLVLLPEEPQSCKASMLREG